MFEKIKETNVTFTSRKWKGISREAINLISRMLVKEPGGRIRLEEALKHPWFEIAKDQSKSNEEESVDAEVIESLQKYKGSSKLKKAAMNLLVKTL